MSDAFSVLIPARLQSTRLPRKLLLPLQGKAVIHHTIDRAMESAAATVGVVVDHDDIKQSVEAYRDSLLPENQHRLSVYLSKYAHDSGTDRIAEVVNSGAVDKDIVVNLQGDEPLLPGALIDQVAERLRQVPTASMATLAEPILDVNQVENPNIVKVIFTHDQEAIYFSRSVIPFQRDPDLGATYYRHIGLYAYRSEWLKNWATLPESTLEKAEKLEQLRVLQAGYRIALQVVNPPEMTGIDSAEQLALAERILATRQ